MTPDSLMMAAMVETGDGFRVRDRQSLFTLPGGIVVSPIRVYYDVSPDDQRFIAMRQLGTVGDVDPTVILVEHWLQEVVERMDGQGG